MIQRIQTLYLSVSSILSLLMFKGEFMNFKDNTGSVLAVTFRGLIKGAGTVNNELLHSFVFITPLLLILVLLPLITLFLYKKRNIQLLFSRILVIISILFILVCGYCAYYVMTSYNTDIIPVLKTIFPVLILLFSILASRGIKRDEDLVKSYDRLR
jgi:phosphoglycerol transferase MdoB-like AlkP superfamily enzyme